MKKKFRSATLKKAMWRVSIVVAALCLLLSINVYAVDVNILSKGATANDASDDTYAIQQAVNAVQGTGGSVIVPAGQFMVNAITGVNLGSNMTLNLQSGAILKAIANGVGSYDMIKAIGVTNVNITGSGKIEGERHEHTVPGDYINKTNGEWGMGIRIGNSSHIYVSDITVSECWGDGIYIGGALCTDIKLTGVICDDNRRQGCSVTWVDGFVFQNCTFKNTAGTAPSAGVDIEPWGAVAHNGQIINCHFDNNAGNGAEMLGHDGGSGSEIQNISVTGCTMSNNTWAGFCGTGYGTGIVVTDNVISDSKKCGGILLRGAPSSGGIFRNNHIYHTIALEYSNQSGIEIIPDATGNTIQDNDVHGNYYAAVRDDVGGNTISGNTLNAPTGSPDLIVTSLSYDQSTHLFSSVVKNQGTGATPAEVIGVGYGVDGSGGLTYGTVAGPLAAGASVTVGCDGGAYTIPNGTHTITAFGDDVNRIAESNETNNNLTQPITIGGGGGSLGGTVNTSSATVNLATVGTADWAHYYSTFDHKSSGGSQISNYTPIGTYTMVYNTTHPKPLSWTGGTPTASSTNNTNALEIRGIGNGVSITAPADLTSRTLYVYAGGWRSGGTLTATLSDGSATVYTNTQTDLSNVYTANYVITYNAASAGKTLTVTWVMTSGTDEVLLAGAALSGGGVSGSLTGSVTTSTANVDLSTVGTADWAHYWSTFDHKSSGGSQISNYTKVGAGTLGFYTNQPKSMSWTGGTPTASSTNNHSGVTNPGGTNCGFSITAPADLTQRTLIFNVGGFNSNGTLTATLSDGSAATYTNTTTFNASDWCANYTLTYKAASAGKTLTVTWVRTSGTGDVTIYGATLAGGGGVSGSLTGSVTTSTANVDLSTVGTDDWTHYWSTFDRKSGGSTISNYTKVGTGTIQYYTNDPRPMSWTNGSPTASSTNNKNGVYIAGVNNGFSITAPADATYSRTLKVYVGGWNSSGTLTATLSDGSATAYTHTTTLASGSYDANYTITYNAASAGKTLTVVWKMASGTTGNVALNGAALASTLKSATIPTGTIDNTKVNTNQLIVYPNPSNGVFTIQSTSDGVYSIVNALGQTMQQVKLNGGNQYRTTIENLSNGIYFIVGFNNNQMTSQKVVVTK